MTRAALQKWLALAMAFLAAWLVLGKLLPILLPFLMGAGLALAAEPMVRFWQNRVHLPRWAAVGVGMTMTLLFLVGAVALLGTLLIRELGMLAGVLPDLAETASQGMGLLEDFLLGLAGKAPDGIGDFLTRTVLGLFRGGSGLLDRVIGGIAAAAAAVLRWIPQGAVGLGTGILSAFLISMRLPGLRAWTKERLPQVWRDRYLPALREMRRALGGWLRAQLKLMLITCLILMAGFFALGIEYAPLWAGAVAVVDAIPVLGTGTVLVPWSLVCVLQGNPGRALGLLGVYAAASLTRSALEPRLVGKQLGLDPLVTLAALYAGYRLWGIWGMLLAPMLAVAAVQLAGNAGG